MIQFAPIAGVTGQSILSLNLELKEIDSIILVEEIDAKREFSTKSQAIVRVLGLMPFPIRLLQLVGLLPRKLLDLLYDAIARNRARLFGTYDHCPLPAPDVRNRFLP